jgi:hypothetical protein
MGGAPQIIWLRPGVGYAPDAAASMRRLEDELGRPHDCNSSYRDYQKQLSMFDAWNRYVASGYNPALYPGHSRALHPDKSAHCLGLADDSDDWATPGYITLASRHGWIRTAATDPTERHHFEYFRDRDNHRYDPAPAGAEEDDMTPDQDARLERIERALNGALSAENQTKMFQDVVAIRSLTEPVFHALMDGRPEYYEGKYNALQILLSVCIQTFAWAQRQQPGGEVDETQLATELAPLLGPLLVENIGTLSEGTLAEIGKRIADEIDRRELARRQQPV